MCYRFAPFSSPSIFLSPLTGIETLNQALLSILPETAETFGVTKHELYSLI